MGDLSKPYFSSSGVSGGNKNVGDQKLPRVVHLFSRYLDYSANWAFFLLKNTPARHTIATEVYTKNTEFRSADFRFIRTFFGLRQKPFAYLNYHLLRLKLRKELKNQDIVHAHFAGYAWKFLSLVKKESLPLVVSFYGYDYESLFATVPAWKEKCNELFRRADMFICEGPNGKKILESEGCDPSKIRVVPLGIETWNVEIIKRKKNRNELKLLQLASFREKKGHVYTIRAFAKALKKCPEMELTLIGDDVECIRPELQEIALQEGVGRKVLFLDGISYDQLYKTLKHYQVFIQPSCYAANRDCEGGAPVAILNAQATGMPVIATTHCDIPSVVIAGETGLLSPEKDVDSLADSIERFYEMDDVNYQTFSKNARAHVERHYDAVHCGRLLSEAYLQIAQGKL